MIKKDETLTPIIIPQLEDNYAYMMLWQSGAFVVDPVDADRVSKILEEEKRALVAILITHHHSDHVAANKELKKCTKCEIIGPNDERIPGLDRIVSEGQTLRLGTYKITVIATPGHTKTHVVYYLPEEKILFTGDALFGAGCGRLFEGTPEEMCASLNKLSQLPQETKIYCGHEYTEKNCDFALTVEPNNTALKKRAEETRSLRKNQKSTIPSTMDLEKQTNPFLRLDSPEIQKTIHLEGANQEDVFSELRKRRNSF